MLAVMRNWIAQRPDAPRIIHWKAGDHVRVALGFDALLALALLVARSAQMLAAAKTTRNFAARRLISIRNYFSIYCYVPVSVSLRLHLIAPSSQELVPQIFVLKRFKYKSDFGETLYLL
jgi:hypothetical protein